MKRKARQAMSDIAFYIVDGIYLDEFGDSYQVEGEDGERRGRR
jgi:hypothetical protein